MMNQMTSSIASSSVLTANQTAVRDAVVGRYLDECKSSSIKEISAKLGWSESKVRRQFDQAPGGLIRGLIPRRDERVTYSRDFPGMQSGVTACWVYEPALWYLRDLLLVATQELVLNAMRSRSSS